jgi:hypothetical protein
MITDNNKYNKLMNLLKNSTPVFNDSEAISERAIKQIQAEKADLKLSELIIEFFFGWIYIGWIRRSLIAAAVVIIVFFGYEQTTILKRINELSGQKIRNEVFTKTNLNNESYNTKLFYSLTGKKLPDTSISVSEKEIKQIIRSLNKLQLKYHDLFYLIQNDPKLKNYIETKMNENLNIHHKDTKDTVER